ncbi:unnamed protein product [Durusdinium trenchii]|uniref:Uncharacterized protein n=1 Tax=Durusdinium trenchii TaxID=1381693 RepID=A0ABP0KH96_9DINO
MSALQIASFAVVSGHLVKVPGETNESLQSRWPGGVPSACLNWAQNAEGYELRRLTTRRAKFFPEYREELLQKVQTQQTQSSQWIVLPQCPATGWALRLLNASSFADDSPIGEANLAQVVHEILSAGEETLLQTLRSRLGLFGLLGLAGRRKLGRRRASALSPVIWEVFTELPHWSPLQRELWRAIRSRRPLPLSASILELAAPSDGLGQAVALLASAQEIRLRSGDVLSSSQIFSEVHSLARSAAQLLHMWTSKVKIEDMVRGLRDWPLIQLLSDLEVSDLAGLQAMGRDLVTHHMVRFLPSPDAVPSIVLPFREPLSDHDRDIGRFHCTTDFFAEVEHWIQNSPLDARLIAIEVACWLPDCLVWAGHRLQGRISAACLEADDLAAAAGRRSVKLNGFEGQVHVLQRRITSSTSSRWKCRAPDDFSHEDNLEENVHLSNDRRCSFTEGKDPNDDVDHLATSIDYEVERLGLERIDILKLSISSLDILRSATRTLQKTNRILLATDPRDTMMQVQFLKAAGFEASLVTSHCAQRVADDFVGNEIHIPVPEKSGGATPYSFYVLGRRISS